MKTMLPLQSQDARSRHVPLCHPKLRPKPDEGHVVPKIHLSYIPPSLRRPSPWSALLSDWLADCEKKTAESGCVTPSSPPLSPLCEDDACSSRSSSSGACSGDTVTTDFSSVSSPRNGAEYRIEYTVLHHPQQHLQPQQPRYLAPAARHHRLPPRPASTGTNLSPAQWAELQQLHAAAARQRAAQPPPPQKLMSIHTAYFPDLDAAVMQMMQPRLQQQVSQSPPTGQPWQPHSYYYPTDQRYPVRGASTAASSSHGSSDSAHFSDYGRVQTTCDFCYQFAVHEAVGRGAHLPRLTDKGPWRGHPMQEGPRIVCQRLLRRVCSMCGATGQAAHLTNLCPVTNRKTALY